MITVNCCDLSSETDIMSDVVQLVATTSTRSGLRSAATINYLTPRLRSKFGERAFSYAGPAAWNRLPETIPHDQTQTPYLTLPYLRGGQVVTPAQR